MKDKIEKEPHLTLFEDFHHIKWTDDHYMAWGSTTLTVPKFHRDNIIELAQNLPTSQFQYSGLTGCPELRKSICEYFSKLFIKQINEDEILITSGAVKAAQIIINSILRDEKDELLIFEPYYPYYFTQNPLFKNIKNFVPIPFKFNQETNKPEINYDDLERLINDNSKLLILINPNNPSTHSYSREDYEKITKIIEKFPNLKVLEDAAYFPYLCDGIKPTYFSEINKNYDRTFTIFSGGKIFDVTGLRCGWAIGPKILMNELHIHNLYEMGFPPTFEQLVIAKNLISSFNPYEGSKNFWEYVAKDSDYRFELISKALKNYPKIKLVKPMGTYYCIADISEYRNIIPKEFYFKINSENVKKETTPELDKAFCRMLISEKIGFMPMSATQNSINKLDYIVRISINRTERDFEIISKGLENIKNKFNI